MNKQQWNNTRYLNRVVNYDYEQHMFNKNDVWYYKYGKNKKRVLLSYSTWMSTFNKIKFDGIPTQILETAANDGKAVMFWLEYIYTNRIKDIDKLNYESQKIQEMVFGVIQLLIEKKWRIIAVEKHITNGYWHGYIDLIVKDASSLIHLIEIKTRTGYELRNTDILQLMVYKKIINSYGDIYVMIIDKITRVPKLNRFDSRKYYELITKIINRPLEAMEMKDYALYLQKKSGDMELYNAVKDMDLSYRFKKKEKEK